MIYQVRPFRLADAPSLAQLTRAAIRQIGPRRYSDEQVEAWSARHWDTDKFVRRAEEGATIFVVADKADAAVAYALIETVLDQGGHLDMLYCHPDHTRRGLAQLLLGSAEQSAINQGLTRLYTEASELARPAFERAGYAVLRRCDFEITNGARSVAIHNYSMEKLLA